MSLKQSVVEGYANPAYAASLAEVGTPRLLPRSGGWIIERPINGFPYLDAMGCYPLFVCADWSQLAVDLEEIRNSLVCLSVVTDPFGDYDLNHLHHCFSDVAVPFKEHFVVDLSRPLETFVHSHHRRNARRALREVSVEECVDPMSYLEDWATLYRTLVDRHHITGIAAFSKDSFARQLSVPGIVVFRAVCDETTVGMLLWYGQGNRAYYHLGAYSPRGYESGASFALFDYSIRYFAEHGFELLNLGSGAGVGSRAEAGLSRFKQGWSTGVRTAYFCGRIFDQEKYAEILRTLPLPPTQYFPAYRVGEFT